MDPSMEKFTKGLRVFGMTPMEKKIALQILESRILFTLIDNTKGVRTITRATIQNESVEKRLEMISILADKIFAIHQTPGKYTAEVGAFKWEKMVEPMLKSAVLEVYGPFMHKVGVSLENIKVKGQP